MEEALAAANGGLGACGMKDPKFQVYTGATVCSSPTPPQHGCLSRVELCPSATTWVLPAWATQHARNFMLSPNVPEPILLHRIYKSSNKSSRLHSAARVQHAHSLRAAVLVLQFIYCGKKATLHVGNVKPIGTMPEGTIVCNLEEVSCRMQGRCIGLVGSRWKGHHVAVLESVH